MLYRDRNDDQARYYKFAIRYAHYVANSVHGRPEYRSPAVKRYWRQTYHAALRAFHGLPA